MGLIVARPADMSYEEYCRIRTEQNRRIKAITTKGALVWLSKIPGYKGRTYVKPVQQNTVVNVSSEEK